MIFKKGYRITQRFGNDPDYYKQFGFKGHEGLDCVPISGDWDILAVEGGKVVRDVDTPRDNYGIYITVLNQTKKRAWWYCHLESNNVNVGDIIRAGQKLGMMGGTGGVSGKHLHLGVRLSNDGGEAINTDNGYKGFLDPLLFLEGENMPDNYKGIDLNNKESVMACVDVWRDIVDGNYVKKEDYQKLQAELSAEKDALNVRINEEKKRYNDFVSNLAEKLNCTQSEPNIIEEVTRAINNEDRATKLEIKVGELETRATSQLEEIKSLRERLRTSSNLEIDKYSGKDLIFKGIVKIIRGR